jgi:hypothetical protein
MLKDNSEKNEGTLREGSNRKQSAKPFLLSSELGHTRKRVCPPPPLVPGPGHTR